MGRLFLLVLVVAAGAAFMVNRLNSNQPRLTAETKVNEFSAGTVLSEINYRRAKDRSLPKYLVNDQLTVAAKKVVDSHKTQLGKDALLEILRSANYQADSLEIGMVSGGRDLAGMIDTLITQAPSCVYSATFEDIGIATSPNLLVLIVASPQKPVAPPSPQPKVETNQETKTVEEPWGVAKQVSQHTWTMKVGFDDRMGTPQEIFTALNDYRDRHGRGKLVWDELLANFATSRAETLSKLGKGDEHAGFMTYVSDQENLKKLGFWQVGENFSTGYRLLGVHLIEWVMAGDEPHDKNQLNSLWSHVGVGVWGTTAVMIFGGEKI